MQRHYLVNSFCNNFSNYIKINARSEATFTIKTGKSTPIKPAANSGYIWYCLTLIVTAMFFLSSGNFFFRVI